MHITSGLVSIIITLFSSGLLGLLNAQNCAIPQSIVLTEESLVKTECATEGTVLATLPTKYLKDVKNIVQIPERYSRVELQEEKLQLLVNQSLLDRDSSTHEISYIDETWSAAIEVQINFLCTDGREKDVNFKIPIADDNTEAPFFEHANYTLTMGPCFNGTHDGKCPLNFETTIRVLDRDRDWKNADVLFYIDGDNYVKDLISVTSVYEKSVLDRSQQFAFHHQKNVHLYLRESNSFFDGDKIEFKLYAYNTITSLTGKELYGSTTITIFFGNSPIDDNSTTLHNPIFTSKVYHTVITNYLDSYERHEALTVRPYPVFAYTTTVEDKSMNTLEKYGYGGGGEKFPLIKYTMNSDIFEIHPYSGTITFNRHRSFLEEYEPVKSYEITATVETYDFLKQTVPFIVFLNIQCGNSTESPECSIEVTCPPPTSTTDNFDPGDGNSTETTVAWTSITTTLPSINFTTTSVTQTTEFENNSSTTYIITEAPVNPTTTSIPSSSTATEITTIPPTTTTENPSNDTCCDDCEQQKPFACPTGNYEENVLFPDPIDCGVFHNCIPNGLGQRYDVNHTCPNGTLFCPESQTCDYPNNCVCTELDAKVSYENKLCECRLCGGGGCYGAEDPRNICTEIGTFPDPLYCDVFHVCEKNINYDTFQDCRLQCGPGTVYCPQTSNCEHPFTCPCDLIVPKCDTCSEFYLNRYNVTLPY